MRGVGDPSKVYDLHRTSIAFTAARSRAQPRGGEPAPDRLEPIVSPFSSPGYRPGRALTDRRSDGPSALHRATEFDPFDHQSLLTSGFDGQAGHR